MRNSVNKRCLHNGGSQFWFERPLLVILNVHSNNPAANIVAHLRGTTKSYKLDRIEETLQRKWNQTICSCNRKHFDSCLMESALIQTILPYENENRALIKQIVTDPVNLWRFK